MNRTASLSRAVFFAFASLILTIIVCAALTFALFVNEVGDNTVHVQAGDLEIAADYLTLTGTRMDTNSQSATYGKLITIPQAETVKNIVLTGNLTELDYCKKKFESFAGLNENEGLKFIIPPSARFATVIGTALCG